MNKETTFHIRLSSEDVEALDFCKEAFGRPRAEIIRLGIHELKKGIEKMTNTEKKYLYKVTRRNGSVLSMDLCERGYMQVLLTHDVDVPDNVREETAKAILNKIDDGEVITFTGGSFITTCKIATPEEAAQAEVMMAEQHEEDMNIKLPDWDTLMDISKRVGEMMASGELNFDD